MKGFTLIEMLVVVLIIGILATVALPQYQSSVEESRVTEAITTATSIIDAQNRSLDAYPNDPVNSKNALDIALMSGTWTSNSVYTTHLFTYTLTNTGVSAERVGGKYTLTFVNNNSNAQKSCSSEDTSFCTEMTKFGFAVEPAE